MGSKADAARALKAPPDCQNVFRALKQTLPFFFYSLSKVLVLWHSSSLFSYQRCLFSGDLWLVYLEGKRFRRTSKLLREKLDCELAVLATPRSPVQARCRWMSKRDKGKLRRPNVTRVRSFLLVPHAMYAAEHADLGLAFYSSLDSLMISLSTGRRSSSYWESAGNDSTCLHLRSYPTICTT